MSERKIKGIVLHGGYIVLGCRERDAVEAKGTRDCRSADGVEEIVGLRQEELRTTEVLRG